VRDAKVHSAAATAVEAVTVMAVAKITVFATATEVATEWRR